MLMEATLGVGAKGGDTPHDDWVAVRQFSEPLKSFTRLQDGSAWLTNSRELHEACTSQQAQVHKLVSWLVPHLHTLGTLALTLQSTVSDLVTWFRSPMCSEASRSISSEFVPREIHPPLFTPKNCLTSDLHQLRLCLLRFYLHCDRV